MSTVRSDRPGDHLGAAVLGVTAAGGVLAVLVALVVIRWPELVPNDAGLYTVVLLTGIGAIGWGVVRLRTAIRTDRPTLELPAVDARAIGQVPGAAVDRALASTPRNPFRRHRQRSAIIDRLRDAAEAVLATRPDVADEPEAALEDGTWTDDALAASVFTDEEIPTRLLDRIDVGRGTVTAPFSERVSRAVDALGTLAGVDPPTASEPADRDTADLPGPTVRSTKRWRGVVALALIALGTGAVFSRPALLLGAAATAGLAGYATLWGDPMVEVTLERRIEPDRPAPGEPVTVTLTVRNVGDAWLPELRIVDGVPPALAVTDGSARRSTALRPGATTTLTYTVEGPRGRIAFDDPVVVARSASGTRERITRPGVEGVDTITYAFDRASETPVTLRAQASRQVGRLLTDDSGPGVEFHSVREYQPGDPLGRIDWQRVARDGDLSTVQFHAERAGTAVVLIDARRPAYVTADPSGPSAVDRSVIAAADLIGTVLAADHRVGLAALSPRSCWIAPAGGSSHRTRTLEALATSDAFPASAPDAPFLREAGVSALVERLPADAQVIAFSPLADDGAVEILRSIEASGHPVTVVSPTPTGGGSPGRRLASIERDHRLALCRRAGLRTVDWGDQPLRIALERASRRWSG
ncbi:MAG: DUF58 domain-containing protein [Halococcoides sp.]